MNLTDEPRTVHTISELNQMVRSLLEDAFPPVWIEGEISNFACPSSGHWYFSLKDAGAQVRSAMFSMKNRNLAIKPVNGMHVLARAKISLYEPRGEFQLIIDYLEEVGDGVLRRNFELLKAKLAAEGLFEAIHKKPLPAFPKVIGVVTSPTGAAIRDILTVLKRRFSNIEIIIYPTLVQGTGSAMQIAKAIALANQRQECEVLIVGRGGGSLEDLWSFNEEVVARTIFSSEIPIISAVGHEIDFTIADFVADVRAATPSAAAELVSPQRDELISQITKLYSSLLRNIKYVLQHSQHQLGALIKQLRHPGQKIQEHFQRLDELEQRLHRAIKNIFSHQQHQLNNVCRALETISPLATLARGYAIVSLPSGEILRNSNQVHSGDKIKTQLHEGIVDSVVE